MGGLILTGGSLEIEFAKEYIRTHAFDTVIAADKGLCYAKELGITPDVILGDFDSCDKSYLDSYSTKDKTLFPCEKDDTDTGLALKKACDMKLDHVTILGAIGTRMDHVLGNLGQLLYAREHGMKALIVDNHNRIQLAQNPMKIRKQEQFGTYISLLPIGDVTGVTLSGFKYPLHDDTLKFQITWGISNELIEDEGVISYKDGILFIMETRD
ncbi:MAG: thiamine diphosphokinase [Anaerostipes sp.]|nr:thiamine diphosphokinase [Anaerostipes sp.]